MFCVGFVTGPEDLQDPQTAINAPRLFVGSFDTPGGLQGGFPTDGGSGAGEGADELHLVIYQCHGIKLCLVVRSDAVMDLTFYTKLRAFITRPLQELGAYVSDNL